MPEAIRVTSGPRSHFFGYYEKTPWDASGRYLLALETTCPEDRRPTPGDTVAIGMIDLQDGNRWIPLAETRAWNWQQGCMLQWRPGTSDEILYNDRRDGQFVGVVRNVFSGTERVLPLPLYGVSPNGRDAISLNFSRLADMHPACGYAGVADPWADTKRTTDDGAYHVDLATGKDRLILSLADAAALGDERPGMANGKHWLNHAQFNTDGSRFGLLHRWREGPEKWRTRLLTVGVDGAGPYVLCSHEMVSHYDWRDEETVLVWARRPEAGDRYYLLRDQASEAQVVGEGILTVDGHCSYSPDRRTILTDTYPDAQHFRTLLLFDPEHNRRTDIGRFYSPPPPDVEIRCDLHPRWDRTGRWVCIDSLHEGQRQIYLLEVSGL